MFAEKCQSICPSCPDEHCSDSADRKRHHHTIFISETETTYTIKIHDWLDGDKTVKSSEYTRQK